jgi:subtilisin family serine protease
MRKSLLALLSFASLLAAVSHAQAQERKNYVVHLAPRDDAADSVEDWHRSFLAEAKLDSAGHDEGPRIIHSYSHVLNGFAARLSDAEAEALRNKEGCLRLYPEEFLPLATTHSPGYLGLHLGNDGFWSRSGFGRGVVIGLLDTGILPSHPSFNDAGLPPPPKEWKGECEFKAIAGGRGCNNKIIGARAFGGAAINTTAPPVDDAGHGTHTASTAAGNFVQNADVRGNARGTAAGTAPHAHLAIYKVCARSRCSIMDVVAGLDAAVRDGVDVLSFSISAASPGAPFNYDLVAIAAFKAMERGIFVSAAAGNDGPGAGTISNSAPWVLSVAAGTTDRAIRTTVRLGNGQQFDGESLYQPRNNTAQLPLVFPGRNGDPDARGCSTLVEEEVRGKVVLCESRSITEHVEQGQTVAAYSGAGMILMNKEAEGYTTFADAHVLPASHVSHAAGLKIADYIKSTPRPTATIASRGTVMGSSPSPSVAFFSSRGPNKASPGILKPDITGPGMNILAAWAPSEMHPEFADNDVNLPFFMESGTSMSTPHLSGIAAIVKSLHPAWSPAMIKSAIMTSSNTEVKDEQYRRASFYAMGTGYVNPARAVDPGLVYDLTADDYVSYLCGLGLGDNGVSEATGRRVACGRIKVITEAELNYPSLVVKLLAHPITVRRTVTNVGKADSVYTAVVDMPNKEVSVTVSPPMLRFAEVNQKQNFTVTVRWNGQPAVAGAEGNLKWVSKDHEVRSPIVVPPATAVA